MRSCCSGISKHTLRSLTSINGACNGLLCKPASIAGNVVTMGWLDWFGPRICFYQPNADSVGLVVEGQRKPWPMRKDAHGNWTARLWRPAGLLQGREYHFDVCCNGERVQFADPLADRTEERDGKLVSLLGAPSYRPVHGRFRAPPLNDIVIYEAHLPALTRHPSAEVNEERHRGTYKGVRAPSILRHLQRMKVAVEFLPLHAHNPLLGQDWGYFSTSFHAMRSDFACNKEQPNNEVLALVDALHGRGIPVLLDVVFNHGGELWVSAWGKEVVYRKFGNGAFCEGSGCGPTIRTEHRHIREMMLKALENLVEKYRFDGFRFDLGALHDKQTLLEIDRRLPRRIYLIAEPWALGGTQWGKADMHRGFAATRWAIWNDDFREPGRAFIQGRGDHRNRDRLMRAIAGSNVRDGGWAVRPQQSINYLSCHDGQTLADLVNGDKRRQFLGVLLLLTSQGVPMLGEGTELMYSKRGHHNSYNRPDLNQIDWSQARTHRDLVEAVARLIALRKQLSHFRYPGHLRVNTNHGEQWDIDWIFPNGYPHNDNVNAIGYCLNPPPRERSAKKAGQSQLLVLLNGSESGVDFHLPEGEWRVLANGYTLEVKGFGPGRVEKARQHYYTHPGSGVILVRA